MQGTDAFLFIVSVDHTHTQFALKEGNQMCTPHVYIYLIHKHSNNINDKILQMIWMNCYDARRSLSFVHTTLNGKVMVLEWRFCCFIRHTQSIHNSSVSLVNVLFRTLAANTYLCMVVREHEKNHRNWNTHFICIRPLTLLLCSCSPNFILIICGFIGIYRHFIAPRLFKW